MGFNSRTRPAPFGVSNDWLDQRDDELREEEVAPASVVRNSPLYLAQVNLVKHLQKQLAAANEKIKALESGAPKKPKRKRSDDAEPPGRIEAAAIIEREGVRWATYRHVAREQGLNQSNVWRQVNKQGITRRRFEDGVWRIPVAQISNIEKKRHKRR